MRIAIIGGGSIGCLYGGNFARVGEEVVIVDVREALVHRLCEEGLAVDGLHGEFHVDVEATLGPSDVAPVDLALICVNGYSSEDAGRSASVLLKDDGFVLSLQNGLGNIESLSSVLGEERVLGGLTFHSADSVALGRVSHTNSGLTYFGELDQTRTDRLTVLEQLLERASMNPSIEVNIMATIWSKFVHNCGINAVCAMTDLKPGHIEHIPELAEFQTKIILEALALVEAVGIELPERDPVTTIKSYCSKKYHRVSMQQHLKAGRRTEIDSLNGYVVSESAKYGLQAPYNDALTRLVKAAEFRSTIPAESRQ